jgi:diketogulonate reductase-like aldo/keto reductase
MTRVDRIASLTRRDFVRRSALGALPAATLAALSPFARPVTASSPHADPSRPRMRTRTIPSTGEAIPVVGRGTWRTFDPPSLDERTLAPLVEVLRVLYDAGGRVVDSSPMYGRAESVTGLLAERLGVLGELFVATKVWTRGEREGVRQLEHSMRELRRERLDLVQVHNLVDWRTQLATLRAWKRDGRVRYIGVTHYVPSAFDELESIVRRERVDFVQLPYSVALRDAERRLLPAAADSGTAVIVNRPFEGGDLFARIRSTPVPAHVAAWASTWGQAFLGFVLAHPAVTCVIPATSDPRHMRDDVAAGTGALPDEEERARFARELDR